MEQTLDVSWKAILKILVIGFLLYILFLSRDIVIWFFFALVISILLEPVINLLRKFRLPKVLAVILVYLAIFGLIGLIIYLTTPIFLFEINQLSQHIPEYFEKLNPIFTNFGLDIAHNFEDFTATLVASLQESSESIIKAITVFFGGLASAALIFAFSFYISLEERGPERVLSMVVPKKYETYIVALFEKAQYKVSGWFGARILACLFVGILSFIIFFLIETLDT